MSEETTAEMLAEIDRDMAEIEKAVSALQKQAAKTNYPQQVETTTDTLAEIEGQAAEYTPPEGWRVLQAGEKIMPGDVWIRPDDRQALDASRIGHFVSERMCYIRRMEHPQPQPQPQPEPQPVQVREGRWRTRGGEIRNVTPTPEDDDRVTQYPWYDAEYDQTWMSDGSYYFGEEHQRDLVKYLWPIEPDPEPEQTITPDDVAAEALAGVWDQAQAEQQIQILQMQVRYRKDKELRLETRLQDEKAVSTKRLEHVKQLRSEVSHVQRLWGESRRRVEELEQKLAEAQPQPVHLQAMIEAQAETIARLHSEINALNTENLELQIQVESLDGRLQEQTAKSAKRLQQVEELRSEVSYVQGLLGDERRRVAELETLAPDLRAVSAAQEKGANAAARHSSDLEFRLQTISAEWAVQAETIRGLQQQLEAVKAELVQVSRDRHLLQVELDAREQVPEAVSDRFDQGFEQGTARAVETIAEWTAPFRTCGSQGLSYHVMQNLPHIMRSLTGLADED